MRRGAVAALMIALACFAYPATGLAAPDVATQVTRQLQAQGYRDIVTRRTLLGRVVVTARGRAHDREIVVDPRSGVLLRDLVRPRGAGRARVAVPAFGDNARQGAAGRGDDGYDDRDYRDDDDRDDDSDDRDDDRDDGDRDNRGSGSDNSGSGSGNSGSGSGNSGRGSDGGGRGRDD